MSSKKITRYLVLPTILCLLISSPALAEITVVENGAESAQGLITADMNELWRIGGDDDDVFFGTLGAVRTDAQNRIFLLDSQLATIHVFSPDGELIKTMEKEGEGPGEVRNPADMFIADDGTICLLQSFPGRIIKLTAEGLPAGNVTYSSGIEGSGQFAVMITGRADGQDMILGGIRMTVGGAISKQTYFLSRCDSQGLQKVSLHEKQNEINYAEFKMDEMKMDFIWNRLAVGPLGKVYAGIERNEYRINIYAVDGSLEKVITRTYTSAARTGQQKKVARQIIEAIAANYPVPPLEITIEDTEAVLGNIMTTSDGRLWVQTSNGNLNPPEGTWVVLDVFDANGTFEKQVALRGNHDASRDSITLLPDGKVLVTVGALDAWLNQQGAGDSEEGAEGGDPLEIICYEVD